MPDITLQSQYVMTVAGVGITNTFFTSLVVSLLLIVCGIVFYRLRDNHRHLAVNALRVLIVELLGLADAVTGDRQLSKRLLPLTATLFLFIATANLLGIVPGFLGSLYVQTASGSVPLLRSPNSDLSTTIALALVSLVSIQYFSVELLGIAGYIRRFFDMRGIIEFLLGLFELISEAVKAISFSFRLFGNVFAGEVLLVVIVFLVPYVVPVPFMLLEVFVGLIQAFIFAALTLVFVRVGAPMVE